MRRGADGTVREKETRDPWKLGHEQDQRHQDQVEREELHRNVIGHVEHENFGRICQANQSPESRGAGKEQQDSTQHLGGTDEHFISRGGAHRGPEDAHRREVAERLHQLGQERKGHL